MNDRDICVYLSEANIALLRDALALLAAADTGTAEDCAWLDRWLREHADEERASKAAGNLSTLLLRAAGGDEAAAAEMSKHPRLADRPAESLALIDPDTTEEPK